MERKLVTYRKVREIVPISGADQIEVAKVDGWQCVVKKDSVGAGSGALYFELDSLLPMIPQFEFMKSRGTKKMIVDQEEKEGYRLRTVKLKGQLSQGLLLPLAAFQDAPFYDDLLARVIYDESSDLSDLLGVIKYEQPIPAELAGLVKGNFPSFIEKTDQERVQNIVEEFPKLSGKPFEVTEKLDGTSMTVYLNNGVFGVCSRNMELKETEGNTFWRVAREMDLENKLRKLGKNIAIQGELVGPGIQKNIYKLSNATCFIFDIFDIDIGCHMHPVDRHELLRELELEKHIIPITHGLFLFEFNSDAINLVLALAEGKSKLNPNIDREGIVFKSLDPLAENWTEPFHFKIISNSYLLDDRDV